MPPLKDPSPVADRLKKLGAPAPKQSSVRTEPLWKGPCDSGDMGGVTFSMLSRYLQCKERFRLYVVEGLKPAPTFNVRLEYGNIWHICEESLAANRAWEPDLAAYCRKLCATFFTQQGEIQKWYNICKRQFPIYVDYWRKHPDVKDRTPLFQEQVFQVPYKLPSGRVVYLRGKWDSVDIIGRGKAAGIYIQENKTKGQIIESQIKSQLVRDLQTMIYVIALKELISSKPKEFAALKTIPVSGVRYNVVRRPLSGGKGNIVQHKPTKKNPAGESSDQFYDRLASYISNDPDSYFMRWSVMILEEDVEVFKETCLDPVLEGLCDWWEWVNSGNPWRHGNRLHSIHPYGVINILNEGGSTDLDSYILSGSLVGLTRVSELFTELK